MKSLVKFFLFTILVTGCATSSLKRIETQQELDRVSGNLASVNQKIYGDYGREKDGKFEEFNEKTYSAYLSTYTIQKAKEVQEYYPSFDVKEFKTSADTFVFCGFSKSLGIVFCDSAACNGVDFIEMASGPEKIETWKSILPKKQCIDSAVDTATPLSNDMGLLAASPGLQAADYMALDHKYFVIHYDKSYRLARYVQYTITEKQMKASQANIRKDNFKMDPLLLPDNKKFAVAVKEYANTGYDKGHLANSKDFSFSRAANDSSFYMSNMVPQKGNLNQDAWRQLEFQVQKWACGEKELKILTGPILKKNLKTLKSGLAIPEKFFKIVLDETPPKKSLAFIYTQEDKGDMMAKRQVAVADLKSEVLPQLEAKDRPDFTKYPVEPIDTWKSIDCFTKKKSKSATVVKK